MRFVGLALAGVAWIAAVLVVLAHLGAALASIATRQRIDLLRTRSFVSFMTSVGAVASLTFVVLLARIHC